MVSWLIAIIGILVAVAGTMFNVLIARSRRNKRIKEENEVYVKKEKNRQKIDTLIKELMDEKAIDTSDRIKRANELQNLISNTD